MTSCPGGEPCEDDNDDQRNAGDDSPRGGDTVDDGLVGISGLCVAFPDGELGRLDRDGVVGPDRLREALGDDLPGLHGVEVGRDAAVCTDGRPDQGRDGHDGCGEDHGSDGHDPPRVHGCCAGQSARASAHR